MHSAGFIDAEYALPHIRQLVLDADPRRRAFLKSLQLLCFLNLEVLQPIMPVSLISELFLECLHLCFSGFHAALEFAGGITEAQNCDILVFKSVRCGSDDRASMDPALMLIAAAKAYQASSLDRHGSKSFYAFFIFHSVLLQTRRSIPYSCRRVSMMSGSLMYPWAMLSETSHTSCHSFRS